MSCYGKIILEIDYNLIDSLHSIIRYIIIIKLQREILILKINFN